MVISKLCSIFKANKNKLNFFLPIHHLFLYLALPHDHAREEPIHTRLYQFQMPFEEQIADFLIFCTNYVGKIGERKK